MVLSDDLLDSQGKVLLPQGTTLTEPTLASLRRHDVEILPILCEALSDDDAAAEREHYKHRIEILFRKHAADEATALMLQYVTNFRLGAQS
jgi:hypothetical protein